jgi:hypothetical protein
MDPIAAAYDLVGALAADDVTSANHALPHTSALHVAVAANVLAQSGPTSDLQELLQLFWRSRPKSMRSGRQDTREGCAD